jgi:DNA-binding NtrC family response regulator
VETADGGTRLRDEIGDMDLALQVKLLRMLEDRSIRRVGGLRNQPVNVRIIAATHRPLDELVTEGRFRADLYFRIRMVHLTMPALRERGDDILLLANHFLALHAQRYGRDGLSLSANARERLRRYPWPGNVRELRNVMEQAVHLSSGPVVDSPDLEWLSAVDTTPSTAPRDASVRHLDEVEREALGKALESSGWNVTRAARKLGITRDALRYRIAKHGLSAPTSE